MNEIVKHGSKSTVLLPELKINCMGYDRSVLYLDSKSIYRLLISKYIKLPKGLLNWCLELELTDIEIQTALIFAHNSCMNIFDIVFQYKISTNILPTNDYLKRYRVRDNNTCSKCDLEFDSICHALYDCEKVVPIISNIFSFLVNNCEKFRGISMIDYLFGVQGRENDGLNHILLELKKFIFYDWNPEYSIESLCELFIIRIIKLIIKEKNIYLKNNNTDLFFMKWNDFKFIYDFRGPDKLII